MWSHFNAINFTEKSKKNETEVTSDFILSNIQQLVPTDNR